jgi:simple sugar transport system substrate-binding protein
VASSVLDGSWQPRPVWGGLKDGFVQLSALSPELPKATLQAVEKRRADIVAGRFAPFSGRLVDQQGRVRLASGALSDAQIAAMDWFVEGVVGSLPKR